MTVDDRGAVASSRHELALTVIGADRVGIIAAVTDVLADLGGNLEDSSMTILRGHFAMTLIVSTEADATQVREAMLPVAEEMELIVDVREVSPEVAAPTVGDGFTLVVQGADRPGIVSQIMATVAKHGGNVTDLTTRLAGSMYLLVAELDLPTGSDPAALERALGQTASVLGVEASLRRAEVDVL